VVSINRGYDDITDEMSIIFWAISTKTSLTILGLIILLILILTWLIRTFDFHVVKQKKVVGIPSVEGSDSSSDQNQATLGDEE
jgi:flagellar biogenesis protein FliO